MICFPKRMAAGRLSHLSRAERSLAILAFCLTLVLYGFALTALGYGRPLLSLQFGIIGTANILLTFVLAILLEQFWDLLPSFALLLTGIVDYGILLRSVPELTFHASSVILSIVSMFAVGFALVSIDVFIVLRRRWNATLAELSNNDRLALVYERYQQALAATKLDCVQILLMILWINRAQTPLLYRLGGSFLGIGSLLAAPITFYSMRENNTVLSVILGLAMIPFPLFVVVILKTEPTLQERSIPVLGVFFRILLMGLLAFCFKDIQAGMRASGYRCDLMVLPPEPELHEQTNRRSSAGYGATGDTIPLNRMPSRPAPAASASYLWDPNAGAL